MELNYEKNGKNLSSTDVRKQDAKFCDIFYFIYVVSWS